MTMLKVVDHNGVEHEVDGQAGGSLMEVLRDLDYGVAALCGGMCACATCHVYVDEAWLGKLPEQQSDEVMLINELSSKKTNSRLSCQIAFNTKLEGIKVTIAPDE